MTDFLRALRMQGHVVWALALREIHGKHGKSRLGYLWQLGKTIFGVAVFMLIREVMGAQPVAGMSAALFLALGFITFFMFSETMARTMEAVKTNRALLTFPQIFPLDLYVSSALVSWVTEYVVLAIMLVVLPMFGYEYTLFFPFLLFMTLLGVGLCGFAVGLCLAALYVYFDVIEKLVPMMNRILFFTSGVFFTVERMPASFREALLWNPILNYVELARSAFMGSGAPDYLHVNYTIAFTFFFLAVGLLLERYIRPRLLEL